jgi:GNAT superfamily N-acetyltransferase
MANELKGWLTHEEVARLSGAPRDSVVTVSALDEGAIELKITNEALFEEPMYRQIIQEASGYRFQILNRGYVLRPEFRQQGIGSRTIALEVQEASRHVEFTRILVHAIGNRTAAGWARPLVGYYTWPRMGFDAPIPLELRARLPPELFGRTRLLQLIGDKAGDKWWFDNGESIHAEFDLAPESVCWQQHIRYNSARGIVISP